MGGVIAWLRQVWRIVLLFAVVRLAVGVVAVAWYERDVALGVELWLIAAACVAVYLLVALAVRRWSPPRAS